MPRPPWAGGRGGADADERGSGHEHGSDHAHGRDGRHGPHGDAPWGRGQHAHFGRGAPGAGMPGWPGGPRLGGPARFRLLEALAAASVPLSVSEVAAAVGVDQPRASRLVQQAAEMGLVRREADPEDARRTRIALTDAGRTIVRGFRGERRDAIDAALGTFTAEERAELARLLTKLAEAWPQN